MEARTPAEAAELDEGLTGACTSRMRVRHTLVAAVHPTAVAALSADRVRLLAAATSSSAREGDGSWEGRGGSSGDPRREAGSSGAHAAASPGRAGALLCAALSPSERAKLWRRRRDELVTATRGCRDLRGPRQQAQPGVPVGRPRACGDGGGRTEVGVQCAGAHERRLAASLGSSPFPASVAHTCTAPPECEHLTEQLFHNLGLLESCFVERTALRSLVHAAAVAHRNSALNNWWHTANCVQATAVLLHASGGGALDKMTPEDALALMLVALLRNVDHPGVTNAFLVRTKDPLAVRYSNVNVLENHSATVARRLLSASDCDVMSGMEPDVRARCMARLDALFREVPMTGAVRTTMRVADRANPAYRGLGMPFASRGSSSDDQFLLLKALIRAAEFGGTQGRPWMDSQHWGGLRAAQWALQGELEKDAKLCGHMASPLMRKGAVDVARNECGICTYVTAPLLRALGRALPWVADLPLKTAQKNALTWAQRVEQNMRSVPPERPAIGTCVLESLRAYQARRMGVDPSEANIAALGALAGRPVGGHTGGSYLSKGSFGSQLSAHLGRALERSGSARSHNGSQREGVSPNGASSLQGSARSLSSQDLESSVHGDRAGAAYAQTLADAGIDLHLPMVPPPLLAQQPGGSSSALAQPGSSHRLGGSFQGSDDSLTAGAGAAAATSAKQRMHAAATLQVRMRRWKEKAVATGGGGEGASAVIHVAYTAPLVPKLLSKDGQLRDGLTGQLIMKHKQSSMGIGGGTVGTEGGPNLMALLAEAAQRHGATARDVARCCDMQAVSGERFGASEDEELQEIALEAEMELLAGVSSSASSGRNKFHPDRQLEGAVYDYYQEGMRLLGLFQATPGPCAVLRFLDGIFWTLAMLIAAVYILFAEDVKYVVSPPRWDGAFAGVAAAHFAVFTLEVLLRCAVEPRYLFKFYFALDCGAALSILPDFVATSQLQDGSRAGRAAAIGARLGRIVKLLRVLQALHVLVSAELRRRERMAAEEVSRLERLTLLSANEAADKAYASKAASDAHPAPADEEHGGRIAQLPQPPRVKAHEKSLARASAVWERLSSLMLRKLILGVLAIVTVYPFLEDVPADQSRQLFVTTLEAFTYRSTGFNTTLAAFLTSGAPQGESVLYVAACALPSGCAGGVPLTQVYGDAAPGAGLRAGDILRMRSVSGRTAVWYNRRPHLVAEHKFTVALTVCVVTLVVTWSSTIARDAHKLLIHPIDKMVNLIELLAKNPLKALEQTHTAASRSVELETDKVIFTLLKVANLLKTALGEAGLSIITANLADSRKPFDPVVPGVRVQAAFSFCDIRKFTDATECLEEGVMMFVNTIAGIVHGAAVASSGAPNKNVGDAFLCVWRSTAAEVRPPLIHAQRAITLTLRPRPYLGRQLVQPCEQCGSGPRLCNRRPT